MQPAKVIEIRTSTGPTKVPAASTDHKMRNFEPSILLA